EWGDWHGNVQRFDNHGHAGIELQNIVEGGEPFERLIDHPAWIDHMKTFLGGTKSFDMKHGPLFIDENFANFRDPGEAIGMHSGADERSKRNQYRLLDNEFMVGQINALIALTDIGPGDGATMVIPGSHKQHFKHPDMAASRMKPEGASGDGVEGAIEVHLQAGDVLVFADAICHGSAKRFNPGQRRNIVYRYGPSWGFFRHGYRPTRELLARLTPERRQIIWPHVPFERTPNLKPGFTDTNASDTPTKRSEGIGG
ncbi:MAG TPA: phytanoyl-CoA dioxygenase family protein, partial [Tepidisphaeraceae bacterium]|nr:phytanoyl-CoA dioxygenase family protein [Tepidisphaeraceae bacterium]